MYIIHVQSGHLFALKAVYRTETNNKTILNGNFNLTPTVVKRIPSRSIGGWE